MYYYYKYLYYNNIYYIQLLFYFKITGSPQTFSLIDWLIDWQQLDYKHFSLQVWEDGYVHYK